MSLTLETHTNMEWQYCTWHVLYCYRLRSTTRSPKIGAKILCRKTGTDFSQVRHTCTTSYFVACSF